LLRRLEEYTVEVEGYRLELEGVKVRERERERQQAAAALVVSEGGDGAVDTTAIVASTGNGGSDKDSGREGNSSSGNSSSSGSGSGSSRTNLLGDSSASSARLAAELALSSSDVPFLRLELTRQLDRCDRARTSYAQVLQKLQAVRGNIQVVCRARPPSAQERALADAEEATGSGSGVGGVGGSGVGGSGVGGSGCKICIDVTDDNEVCCYDRRVESWKSFVFDRVWPVDATQGEVFADVEPLVLSVVEGYNTCLFAYGQVGRHRTCSFTPSVPSVSSVPRSPLSLA
jgi:hypothetical protein